MSWPTRLALPQPPMELQAVLLGLPSVVSTMGRPLAAGIQRRRGQTGVAVMQEGWGYGESECRPWMACHIML